MIKLESIDLNLLVAFEALMLEQSVTRAAERVGVTQPAMSNALARLRQLIGDPLFVRRAGAMEPTRRAEQLIGPVGEAMAKLRAALEGPPLFDPATAAREFRISTTDYVESVLIPPLMTRLTAAAPGVSVRCLRPANLFEIPGPQLQSGDVDLAVGFYGSLRVPAGVLGATLFEERFVCIARRGHPRVTDRLDLRAFTELPQVRVLYREEERAGMFDVLLRSRGSSRRVGLTVSHTVSTVGAVAQSDMIGIIPEMLARQGGASKKVRVFPIPVRVAPVEVRMLWHERNRFDPAQEWLRGQLLHVAETTFRRARAARR